MKEFLYQIFSNHFSNPIQKDKIKTVFILVFILYSHLLFHFFLQWVWEYLWKIIVPPPGGGSVAPPEEGRVVRSLQKVPNIIFIPTPKIFLHLFAFFNFRTIRIIFTRWSVISFFFFYNFYYLFYVCKNSCIFITTVYFHNFFVYFILNHWQVFRLKFWG